MKKCFDRGEKALKVETHSGYKADEYPTALWLKGRRCEVMDVEDRWYGPGYAYFRIFLDNGTRCILRQDQGNGVWRFEK